MEIFIMTRKEKIQSRVLMRKQMVGILRRILADYKFCGKDVADMSMDELRHDECSFVALWCSIKDFTFTLEELNKFDNWELDGYEV